ncbi:exocyst complex component 1 [Aricia agestis]|uniref:exocyst complex component 1 n=1 Tax=Aricia agestis TaxID=91739 RepID=UPI001C2037FC|nr:exocyst complex component 1 [Aricia agestis]
MKLEDSFSGRIEGVDAGAISVEVTNGDKKQRLAIDGNHLILFDNATKLRSWPLHSIRIKTDLPDGGISIESNGEILNWSCADERSRAALAAATAGVAVDGAPSDAALAALLDDADPDDADAERRVKRLGDTLARLDALNVAGMLAAATDGGGARLAEKLEAGVTAGAGVSARLGRLEALTRAAPAALSARSGAARADAAARALLSELAAIYRWLDPPELADLDALPEISLATAEGRAKALAAADALRTALRGGPEGGSAAAAAARARLGAVRERLRRLGRARDALSAALARHLNNVMIHLANERKPHHAGLLVYAPFMRWLKDMDEKAFDGLLKVYVGTWSRSYERELAGAAETARGTLQHASHDQIDPTLDRVLTLAETLCNAEQDFCMQFFHLDYEPKSATAEGGDSAGADGGEAEAGVAESTRRGGGAAARKLRAELFPALEAELVGLVAFIERLEPYGAMRALACAGRRVLGEGGDLGSGMEARWARAALAAAAVAAKRGADRAVADRLAALADAVKQAAKRPKCGVLSFIPELEEMSGVCEAIFAGGRRADLDRWYLSLCTGMVRAVAAAQHPRTPRAVVQLENYHRLHAVVSALRVPALEGVRRDAKARYAEALRSYVTQYFGRPLEKLAAFFDRVAEAVASGVREEEVCYRAAFSKHEARRVLALYPAAEVRRALHRLYRTVEKHLSEEGGLLQVVWRAMQEEFIAQHVALQARLAACYPGAHLAMPLSTQDILDAFSDIAREH